MVQNLIFCNARLFFVNFLYLFCVLTFVTELALASDSGFFGGLDENNMMTCSLTSPPTTTPTPFEDRYCYLLHYEIFVDSDNLDESIESFKKFNLKSDPWLGFAMRFNAVLDMIIRKNNHTKLALLRLAVAKPYADFIRTEPSKKKYDEVLSLLSFERYSDWNEVFCKSV